MGLRRVPLELGDLVRVTLEFMGMRILWGGSDESVGRIYILVE